MAKFKTMSFQVSEVMYDGIVDLSVKHEVSISTVIRAALLKYINTGAQPIAIPATPDPAVVDMTDGSIQPAFSIGGIIPHIKDEGGIQRLKTMGIDPSDVIRAKRAKKYGRDYDTSLEQYFDMV